MAKSEDIPSDAELQRMFGLAYFLHPERLVALHVTLEACDWISHVSETNSRRVGSDRGHKLRLPPSSVHRFAVYAASQSWEIDQESSNPQKKARYQPNPDDRIVRYIEFLIWKAMERPCCYAAVGVGRYLYSYKLNEISAIAPDFFGEENIRRINGYFADWLAERFQSIKSSLPAGKAIQRAPTEREATLINAALEVLSPRYSIPAPVIDPPDSLLEKYFGAASQHSELERNRSVLDPRWGGFARLVTEYNSLSAGKQLIEPHLACRTPKFDDNILAFPSLDDRMANRIGSALSPTEIIAIKHNREGNK